MPREEKTLTEKKAYKQEKLSLVPQEDFKEVLATFLNNPLQEHLKHVKNMIHRLEKNEKISSEGKKALKMIEGRLAPYEEASGEIAFIENSYHPPYSEEVLKNLNHAEQQQTECYNSIQKMLKRVH